MRNSVETVAMRKLASSKIFRVQFYLDDLKISRRLDLKELNNEIANYYKNKDKEMIRRNIDLDMWSFFEHKEHKVEWDSFVPKYKFTNSYRDMFDEYEMVATAKFKEMIFADTNSHNIEMGFKIFAENLSVKDLKQLLYLGLKYKSYEHYDKR